MTDDPRNQDQKPASDSTFTARLTRLRNQVAADDAARSAPRPAQQADNSAMARGLRMSSEMVAGVLVGAVIGYLLDRWLGISPWGLIVFVMLGFAAGILNVMRAAGVTTPGSGPRQK